MGHHPSPHLPNPIAFPGRPSHNAAFPMCPGQRTQLVHIVKKMFTIYVTLWLNARSRFWFRFRPVIARRSRVLTMSTNAPVPGEGTHSMKVTTYAPPFRPPFFRSLENLYSFDPYFLAKMRKMSYFDPYFLSKFGKMYSFDPPFSPFVAFRVNGRCWASLSKTQPRTR